MRRPVSEDPIGASRNNLKVLNELPPQYQRYYEFDVHQNIYIQSRRSLYVLVIGQGIVYWKIDFESHCLY